MTFKDTTTMTEKELDHYEAKLLDLYEETFGESYPMGWPRENTDVVVADLIKRLNDGTPKPIPEPIPEGCVL